MGNHGAGSVSITYFDDDDVEITSENVSTLFCANKSLVMK